MGRKGKKYWQQELQLSNVTMYSEAHNIQSRAWVYFKSVHARSPSAITLVPVPRANLLREHCVQDLKQPARVQWLLHGKPHHDARRLAQASAPCRPRAGAMHGVARMSICVQCHGCTSVDPGTTPQPRRAMMAWMAPCSARLGVSALSVSGSAANSIHAESARVSMYRTSRPHQPCPTAEPPTASTHQVICRLQLADRRPERPMTIGHMQLHWAESQKRINSATFAPRNT